MSAQYTSWRWRSIEVILGLAMLLSASLLIGFLFPPLDAAGLPIQSYEQICNRAGGVMFSARGTPDICIKPEALLDIAKATGAAP